MSNKHRNYRRIGRVRRERHAQRMRHWLQLAHGLVGPEHWRLLLDTSEDALLHLALHCALRGDRDSLAHLCDTILVEGRAPDFLLNHLASSMCEMVLTSYQPGSTVLQGGEEWRRVGCSWLPGLAR